MKWRLSTQPWWVTKFCTVVVGCQMYCSLYVTLLVPRLLRCILYFWRIHALPMQIIWGYEVVWYQKKLVTFLVPLYIFTAQKTLWKILTLIHFHLLPQILGIVCFRFQVFLSEMRKFTYKWNVTTFLAPSSLKSLNHLQPTGHVMHHQFNIQQLYALPTLYLCFVFIWEQTATCATYNINWLVFITEMKSVYSAVRTGSLNTAVCASSVKG